MFEKTFRVVDETGFIGTLKAPARFLDARTEKVIELEQGGQIIVKAEDLKVQHDGSFFLQRSTAEPAPGDQNAEVRQNAAAPSVARSYSKTARTADSPAPARNSEPVAEQSRSNELPNGAPPISTDMATAAFFADDYDIERVPINKVVDAPVASRQEGDTLILPVMEEVQVIIKKTLLKEEVRITRRRKPVEQVRRIEENARP